MPASGRFAFALLALLPNCGGEQTPGSLEGASVGNMAGAGSMAGAGAGQAVGGGAGTGGAGGGSGAGSLGAGGVTQCSSFADDTGWSLLVRITNERDQVLYLGQDSMSCDPQHLFQVEDGARRLLPSLGGCRSSCEALMRGAPVVCPEACVAPATVTLEPGQTLEVPWDGRFGVEETLPAQCLGAAQGPGSCVRAERIEASIFTFLARAGTSRHCLQGTAPCDCTPSPTGSCTSPESLIGGTIYTTEFIVALEPGETSPSGEPPFIRLVFQN